MATHRLCALGAAFLACVGCRPERAAAPPTQSSFSSAGASGFTLFESGQVRPLALSPQGNLLFATNTPANRLEVFSIQDGTLVAVASIPVGLEPVAVAARTQNEVWVVNHLSDSVSIVDVSDLARARVVRTLLVGDEPRDIVFAGSGRNRAFVTTAHRGQNSPVDPQLTTPGVGRADVWAFDANGAMLSIVTLFCDTPRALAVSPDGATVYAAAFHSGNRTATIARGSVPSGSLPAPRDNFEHVVGPDVGLIVKYREGPDGSVHWLDKLDRIWDDAIRFSLPDRDVFTIDADADPPVARQGSYSGVGTVLFNLAVNPVSGKIYVSNTDAQNDTRFEGSGEYAYQESGLRTVRGHIVESRITILNGAAPPASRHLNKHIDYSHCCDPTPNAESAKSLAFPTSMAVSNDGNWLYVTAFGSSKLGIFSTGQLEDDSFVPDTRNQVLLTGGGPSGVALDEARSALYVLTRFDNSISIVDLAGRTEIFHVAMFNPEPPSVVNGRPFLYDAANTSSHGDSACASCHVFGDFDSLAWDLGDPDNSPFNDPGPFVVGPMLLAPVFHPLKGPMTTQSLRGMDNHGPMHWRGDRTGGNDAESRQPDSGSFDEVAGFKKFNVAFPGLLGRSDPLTDEQMQAFTDFILQLMYPPNPIRNLDNSLTDEQQAGQDFFLGISTGGLPSDTFVTCNGCHVLDPDGNREFGVARPGFFGSDGRSSFENETQLFKIPHLRNLYQKVGMFGMSPDPFFPSDPFPFMGDQVRGFGFLHDGSTDTLFRFHGASVFIRSLINPGGIPPGAAGQVIRRQLEAYLLAFDNNLAPIVGQQVTLTSDNGGAVGERIDRLEARATANECDLVVKGRVEGQAAGFLYSISDRTFVRRRSGDLPRTDSDLRALASSPGNELTFTCVPPGAGLRIAEDL
jgi:DNA-binding beta-propeller fold protein YncE